MLPASAIEETGVVTRSEITRYYLLVPNGSNRLWLKSLTIKKSVWPRGVDCPKFILKSNGEMKRSSMSYNRQYLHGPQAWKSSTQRSGEKPQIAFAASRYSLLVLWFSMTLIFALR